MIGAIIGGVASVAGSLLGGAKAASEAREAEKILQQQKVDNENWWRLKQNMDYTQTASAQQALNKGRKMMLEGINNARGAQAVMGGSDASIASSKAAANNAIADAVANVAIAGEAKKDAAEAQYLQQKASLNNQQIGIHNQRAAANTAAASGAMQAGLGLASADAQAHLDNGKGLFDGLFRKKGA